MGTRHLIAVIKDGDYKIAQYGQWDGYPSGQGVEVLAFLRDNDLEDFSQKLELCQFGTEEDIEKAYEAFITKHANGMSGMNLAQANEFAKSKFWYLGRDTGSNILQFVMSALDPILLKDSRDFVKDSLFCEWAYIIDMDRRVLEVYKGFNEAPVPDGERFASLNSEAERGYYPVRLVKEYSFDALPESDVFTTECDPPEPDEDEDEMGNEA